jgi:hypothetical protein
MAVDWTQIMMMAAASGSGGVASAYTNAKDRQAQAQQNREGRELTEAQFNRQLAFDESLENPFRQQRSQATTMAQMDMLEQLGRRQPANVSGIPYAQQGLINQAPQLSPQTMMAGRTAPDYTEDANRGVSAVMDLNGVASGRLDPSTDAAFANGAPLRRYGWIGQPGAAQPRSNNRTNATAPGYNTRIGVDAQGRTRSPVGRSGYVV